MRLLPLLAFLVLTPLAPAEVITFSGTTSDDSTTFQTEGSFTFGNPYPGSIVYENFGNPGVDASANISSGLEITVPMYFTATNGGTFTFGGLDMASFTGTSDFGVGDIYLTGYNHGIEVADGYDSVAPLTETYANWTTETAGPLAGITLDKLEIDLFYSNELFLSDTAIDNVILTPTAATTPEPSSVLLLGTGLVSLAGLLRRRLS